MSGRRDDKLSKTNIRFFVCFCVFFVVVFYFLSSIRLTRSVMFKGIIAINENGAIKFLTRKDIIIFYHSCTT